MQSMRERIHLKKSKCQEKRFCLTLSFHINSSQYGIFLFPDPHRGESDNAWGHFWLSQLGRKGVTGKPGMKLLTSYSSQNSPYHNWFGPSCQSHLTVLWNLHYIKAMNSFFHNKFIICLQMLMTCDFSLDFYFINTSDRVLYDGSG